MKKRLIRNVVNGVVESLEIRRQLSAGLAPHAIAAAGGVVARPVGNTGTGFFVSGTQIYDANGNPFVLRGINSTARDGNNAKNLAAIAEFPKTGANAVRAVFGTFGVGVTPLQRQSIAEEYINEGIVPVVEDHSATGGSNAAQLQSVVDRWLLPANVAWLKKDEKNIILNIANEWGPDSTVWRDAYISSVARLRAAGVNALLMIDAGGSGQNVHTLETWAQDVEDADPQHNVVFSIHLYNNWRTGGATDVGTSPYIQGAPWDIATEMTKLHAAGLPVVAGEFSFTDGVDVPYDTRAAMQIFDSLGMGWMAWSWNQNGNPAHDLLASTAGFEYDSDADLSAFGQLVINDPTLGLKATARPTTTLRPGTISGTISNAAAGKTVFIDDNGNGKLDAGERSTVTKAGGAFTLTNLPQGLFRLSVSGLAIVPTAVALTGGDTASVTLTPGAAPAKATLSGAVFDDTSRDGSRAAAEASVRTQKVFLDLNGNGVPDKGEPTATTNAQGQFKFTGLAAGTYAVGVVLGTGYERTSAVLPVALTTGQQLMNLNIGIDRPPATGQITGTFFIDRNKNGIQDSGETGQPSKAVFLDLNNNGIADQGEPTTTTTNGTYLFTRVAPGTYTVRRDAAGWNVTTPGATVTVTAFETATAAPIGAVELVGSFSGTVYNDANGDGVIAAADKPVAGVIIYIDRNNDGSFNAGESSVTTDAAGAFHFTGLWSGNYPIRAVPPTGLALTTGTTIVALATNQTLVGVQVGVGVVPPVAVNGVISGIYFNDANADRRYGAGETPVAKARVYLDLNNDGIYDAGDVAQTTAGDGSFKFSGLAAGTYALRAVLPANRAFSTATYDVILSPQQQFTIARIGIVPSATTAPVVQTLQGENALLVGGTVQSTTYGGYLAAGFADFAGAGSGVMWTFTRPAAGPVSVVFRYANGSGKNRPLTLTINGVAAGVVAFPDTGGWTTWAATTPVELTLPAGTNTLRAIAGAAGGANVDQVALTNVDRTASLAGTAFSDNNADGKYAGGDGPSKGVKLFLDTDNDGVLDPGEVSVLADSSGRFSFTGLAAGVYHVRRVLGISQRYTTPPLDVTLATGQVRTGLVLGTTKAVT